MTLFVTQEIGPPSWMTTPPNPAIWLVEGPSRDFPAIWLAAAPTSMHHYYLWHELKLFWICATYRSCKISTSSHVAAAVQMRWLVAVICHSDLSPQGFALLMSCTASQHHLLEGMMIYLHTAGSTVSFRLYLTFDQTKWSSRFWWWITVSLEGSWMVLTHWIDSLELDYHLFCWYATLENKTPAEVFPKFPSVICVIDGSDQNPPITATRVTFWPSLCHSSGLWLVDFDPISR